MLQNNRLLAFRVFLLPVLLVCFNINNDRVVNGQFNLPRVDNPVKNICVSRDNTIRAKRKACLLRPDSGPCRADILAYYYDANRKRCFRFFYGGCQGNGNNFVTRRDCLDHCMFNGKALESSHTPYFCSLAFDFGNCFGQYNRWAWDKRSGHCMQRIYSGCGGNQNNFQTKKECMMTCLFKPNNTLTATNLQFTTCIPISIPGYN